MRQLKINKQIQPYRPTSDEELLPLDKDFGTKLNRDQKIFFVDSMLRFLDGRGTIEQNDSRCFHQKQLPQKTDEELMTMIDRLQLAVDPDFLRTLQNDILKPKKKISRIVAPVAELSELEKKEFIEKALNDLFSPPYLLAVKGICEEVAKNTNTKSLRDRIYLIINKYVINNPEQEKLFGSGFKQIYKNIVSTGFREAFIEKAKELGLLPQDFVPLIA